MEWMNYWECTSNFPSSWLQIDNGIFNRPIMAHTQILVHIWGPEQGICRCFADRLNQKLFPSVALATLTTTDSEQQLTKNQQSHVSWQIRQVILKPNLSEQWSMTNSDSFRVMTAMKHKTVVLTNSRPATSLPFTAERVPIHLIKPYRGRSWAIGTSTTEPTSKP